MTDRDQHHGGTPPDHSRQLPRLRRIEGQIRGLGQMIESKRDCMNISQQIDAVVAALRRVQADMLRDHLEAITRAILSGELPEDEHRRLTDELAKAIARRG